MIAGGKNSDGQLTDVYEYDIDSNSYNNIQMLPDPKLMPVLVKDNYNYMYLFGGFGSKEVLRIKLTLFDDWEKLEDMKETIKDPLVIPYN